MEQASDSSNSAAETATSSSKHKKPSHKKDKNKTKLMSESEGSKSPPVKETETTDLQSKIGNPAQVHSRTKTAKPSRKQSINSESQTSGSVTDSIESLPKSNRASYAENTTSGEEPSVLDDINMSPTCEATVDAVEKPKEPLLSNKKDQTKAMPTSKSYNTEDN